MYAVTGSIAVTHISLRVFPLIPWEDIKSRVAALASYRLEARYDITDVSGSSTGISMDCLSECNILYFCRIFLAYRL